MKTYQTSEPCRVEWTIDDEIVVVKFAPGKHKPKNEREEHALELIVKSGHAEVLKQAKES